MIDDLRKIRDAHAADRLYFGKLSLNRAFDNSRRPFGTPFLRLDELHTKDVAYSGFGAPEGLSRGIDSLTYVLCDAKAPDDEFWAVQLLTNSTGGGSIIGEHSTLLSNQVPLHRGEDGVIAGVIAGVFDGIIGPSGLQDDRYLFLDIHIPPLTPFNISIPREYQVLIYCLEGDGLYEFSAGRLINVAELLQYDQGTGIALSTNMEEVRLLLLAGKSIS